MSVDVLLGLQWGDEGKGKIVDVLTPQYDVIARFQGGPNAGHTIIFGGNKYVLHTIPSGIFYDDKINIVGNGAIIDPHIFMKEVEGLLAGGFKVLENLKISKKSHLILPTHRLLDAAYEKKKGKQKIGSTLKGIGPTYTDKVSRVGLRVGEILSKNFTSLYRELKEAHFTILKREGFNINDMEIDGKSFEEYEILWLTAIEKMKHFSLIDSDIYINSLIDKGKKILAEGAQGSLLDIDFGSYPFVTSSNTTIAGVSLGLGVAPRKINKVYGIVKAYCTRVGEGPFPTELFDEIGEKLQRQGGEFGATTGRARRCGWLDLPALKYAVMLNGVTDIILTKADVMNNFKTINVCTGYNIEGEQFDMMPYHYKEAKPILQSFDGWQEELRGEDYEKLPQNLRNYVAFIEQQTGVRVSIVSTGPDRVETIFKE